MRFIKLSAMAAISIAHFNGFRTLFYLLQIHITIINLLVRYRNVYIVKERLGSNFKLLRALPFL